jgi:hypothetical protein
MATNEKKKIVSPNKGELDAEMTRLEAEIAKGYTKHAANNVVSNTKKDKTGKK